MEINNLNQSMMPVNKIEMRSVIDLIKDSLATFKIFAPKFIILQLLQTIMSTISTYILLSLNSHNNGSNVSLLQYIIIFLEFFFYIIAQIGQLLIIKSSETKKSILELLKESMSLFANYFVICFLLLLIIFVGTSFFIAPGLYFGIIFFFSPFIFIFESKKGLAAFKRSKNLVAGNWWKVFLRMSFILIIFYLWTYIFAILLPIKLAEFNSSVAYFSSYLVDVGDLFFLPLMLIYFYFIYQDLVKMKDINKTFQI